MTLILSLRPKGACRRTQGSDAGKFIDRASVIR
jgi:hypothetical protein